MRLKETMISILTCKGRVRSSTWWRVCDICLRQCDKRHKEERIGPMEVLP